MRCPAKKAAARGAEKKDRISSLPDELIHKILSVLDAKVAVQTSTLSKRWKPVWTSLPYLNIGEYERSSPRSTYKFIRHVLINRNHEYDISQLNLCAKTKRLRSLVDEFVEYAISHNVECLNLDLRDPYKLSNLSSSSLNKLTLAVVYLVTESECWDLPALMFLRLVAPLVLAEYNLPESFLTCLPALTTLCLEDWKFSDSLFSFSLPHLTTLCLSGCYGFPQTLNLPALLSLDWDGLSLTKNICDVISKLVNLQNLNLSLSFASPEQDYILSCPELLNLNIVVHSCHSFLAKTRFFAPKLCKFSFYGIIGICLEAPKVESVNVNLSDWVWNMDWIYRKYYYRQFTDLLLRLGNAKILTFDSGSIQALSEINFLSSLPSPFYNLKLVKLPNGYEESSISSDLRSYLLDGSPRATIITTWPQDQVNHQAVPMTTNLNSVVDVERVCQLGVSVAGTSNDRASSSRGHGDFGLWHGHEVNTEFVGLLDLIMKYYPETFAHFTVKIERFYTVKLNMLCTTVNEFLRTSKNEFNTEIISEYRDLFADMRRWGFGVDWLVSHLNYIEQLLFSPHELRATDSCMDDANNKLKELQTLCLEKITAIQKASG